MLSGMLISDQSKTSFALARLRLYFLTWLVFYQNVTLICHNFCLTYEEDLATELGTQCYLFAMQTDIVNSYLSQFLMTITVVQV